MVLRQLDSLPYTPVGQQRLECKTHRGRLILSTIILDFPQFSPAEDASWSGAIFWQLVFDYSAQIWSPVSSSLLPSHSLCVFSFHQMIHQQEIYLHN